MKNLIFIAMLLAVACIKTIYLPSETRIVDREVLKDTTVYVYLDREVQRNTTRADSSFLENRFALSWARVDSAGLNHVLEQKDAQIPFRVIYKDKVLTRDSNVYITQEVKGDTVYREVVPRWCWWLLAANILAVIGGGIKIIRKFI